MAPHVVFIHGMYLTGQSWQPWVERFVSAGRPIATHVNYGCHPTTLGPNNLLYSADYPGVLCRRWPGQDPLQLRAGVLMIVGGFAA